MMIAFSGLDGSGKSTQIRFVEQYFIDNGHTPYVIWSRGGYTNGMERLKGIIRLSMPKSIPKESGKSTERDAYFANPLKRKIWLFLAILDLIILYSITLRLKKLRGIPIICDRYIFDTSLDFELNFPQENVNSWVMWKLLKRTAIKPTYHFILTISVDESLRRSDLKNEPFPDSRETLVKRLAKYLDLCVNNDACTHLDCSDSVNNIKEKILRHIEK